MALITLNVRQRKEHGLRAKNYNSEAQVYESGRIIHAIPSISRKGTDTDGATSAKVLVDEGELGTSVLYVTQTVATIAGLS